MGFAFFGSGRAVLEIFRARGAPICFLSLGVADAGEDVTADDGELRLGRWPTGSVSRDESDIFLVIDELSLDPVLRELSLEPALFLEREETWAGVAIFWKQVSVRNHESGFEGDLRVVLGPFLGSGCT